ncbi:uncharacterized protein LOC18432652 isoform X1 [Amborella trichopoda]|uniref:uncharacterized protein LOC18432652 isoform X1 n=2 Tax=Amborella trichopoda TaxID=13333 RepID=UPI0005D38C6A|nr:uncharacterized protein LOC18432652 isoform X1 [Amborella trichopoda]|eukprot:XP_011622799.1 uncharacterized protein LOC18432652 isoform X1 [Amborella trichopoda]
MSLTGVIMSEEVWLTCLTHAFSTETEEIMGLLLGDVKYSSNGGGTALIWGASPQTRSDRSKDRVETNPEQLAAASAEAERMTLATGTTTRVIGWYHSHPHITVLPSHVDVRTQGMYQLLDAGFIGLIFSCFSEDARKVGRIQVIAFQSLDGKQKHVARLPLQSSPVKSSSVIEVASSRSSSENISSTADSSRAEMAEQGVVDSTMTSRATKGVGRTGSSSELENFFSKDVNYLGRKNSSNNLLGSAEDLDPSDMSASMQEAMHRSNLDMSGAEYVRKEVPLQVVPSSSLLKLDYPLKSYMDLQRILFEEERAAYHQAISQSMRNDKIHPLAFIHHTSTYQASICKLMEYCLCPAISSLQDRLKDNEMRLSLLKEEAATLEEAFNRESGPNLTSPRQLSSPSSRGGRQRDFSASLDLGSTKSISGGVGGRSRKAS